jgi:hypothetical protein
MIPFSFSSGFQSMLTFRTSFELFEDPQNPGYINTSMLLLSRSISISFASHDDGYTAVCGRLSD